MRSESSLGRVFRDPIHDIIFIPHSAEAILELRAYAYVTAKQWKTAASMLKQLAKIHEGDGPKLMEILQSMCLVLQQAGEFDKCRKLLSAASKRYPRDFRRHGLHHIQRNLPK